MTSMTSEALSLTPRVTLVRANNPSPMTLKGTNTYLLREPGSRGVVVVDPGPLDEQHLHRILELASHDDGYVALVLFTHWHVDHTESIDRFSEMTGAPARAFDAKWCRDAQPLTDAELLEVDGLHVRVLCTPGHTMDSVCFVLPAEASLLAGDTVLGTGTTVIAHPDGALAPYLESLQRIRSEIEAGDVQHILPGHGPFIDSPLEVIDGYIAHRHDRLQQVRDALDAGDRTAREVVERVYANVDRSLWGAAEWSVRAQMEYLSVKE